MNILAMDTSGPSVSVALTDDTRVLFESVLTHGRTHSEWLMPMVERALAETGKRMSDIDLFAVVHGPGSFTGVRIGVVATRTMAQVADRPCIGINALEALAMNLSGVQGAVCPILDARAGQVYGAAFAAGLPPKRLLPDEALKLPEYLDKVRALGMPLWFVGDGVPVFAARIAEALGDRATCAPMHAQGLKASAAATLARHHAHEAVGYEQLLPYYLRAPQAERERAAREALHG